MRHPPGGNSNPPNLSVGDHPPHYNPNQPRVPAGHHGGGQWTRGGFGHNDPVVRLAFEDRTDPLRRIDSPPLAPTQPPRPLPKPRLRLKGVIGVAIGILIDALLRQNDPDQQPVLVLHTRDNYRDSQGVWRWSLDNLTQKEVDDICGEQIKNLQGLLDEAVQQVQSEGKNLAPGPFGTRGHQVMRKSVDNLIKQLNDAGLKTEFLIGRNEETGKLEILDQKNNTKGSVRLDLGHFNGIEAVCITDYKFGERGLENARIEKIVEKIKELFPHVKRILITEAKPTWSPLFKPKQ